MQPPGLVNAATGRRRYSPKGTDMATPEQGAAQTKEKPHVRSEQAHEPAAATEPADETSRSGGGAQVHGLVEHDGTATAAPSAARATPGQEVDASFQQYWWGKYSDLLWDVRRSRRYHDRREQFLLRTARTGTWLSLVGSSATVFAVIGGTWGATLAGLATMAISAFNLAVGAGDAARKHNDLRRRFIALEVEMVRADQDDLPAVVRDWAAEYLKIESDEPPIMGNLDRLCHNELVRAEGRGKLASVGWCARWLSNVLPARDIAVRAQPKH